jgi:hypothetical protein
MAITLGDSFQNWNPDTGLSSTGATVDGGIISALEPNLFRDKVMLPGITYATDVESLMIDKKFAVAFIRKLDKIPVKRVKATSQAAFRVVPTQTDGQFIEIKCNDVLKVGEVVSELIDAARVSGQTADKVALAGESYDEVKELQYLSYLINGGGSPDPTDVGAPASANTEKSDSTTVIANIITDRATLLKAGAKPDVLLISVDIDSALLNKVSEKIFYRSPSDTELAVLGAEYAGSIFSGKVKVFTTNSFGQDNSALLGEEPATAAWDWTAIEYVLYDHNTMSIVNVLHTAALVDYQAIEIGSTLISICSICGGRIRNTQKVICKKYEEEEPVE